MKDGSLMSGSLMRDGGSVYSFFIIGHLQLKPCSLKASGHVKLLNRLHGLLYVLSNKKIAKGISSVIQHTIHNIYY